MSLSDVLGDIPSVDLGDDPSKELGEEDPSDVLVVVALLCVAMKLLAVEKKI